MSMARSLKPNLRHLNRSLTIRHFFTPPMVCSTRIRKLDIFLCSSFCLSVNFLRSGFLTGILIVMFFGACARSFVSCHKVFPVGKATAGHPLFIIANKSLVSSWQQLDTLIRCIKQVILQTMGFFRCGAISVYPDLGNVQSAFPSHRAKLSRHSPARCLTCKCFLSGISSRV